ncbi:hypothetical protein QYE76_061199 [Lolium multiflorum]|uniref:Ribonuclease H1 N-terminal domain-containing protein n=1 Tax=Lolium multiflorum TaxID=4521 RepID=A0AAD8S0I7_LOLMU|nr:hypothetical protein QYE76_061199 [Lolium multiflorum]
MSNALSSWKSRVKAKIDKGESFESIKKGEPMLDEAEFQIFKERLDSDDAKAWTEWGRQMHELNLGAHHLGSGGYRGKIPIWEKEDEELARAGKPNPWLKITDLQVRYFVPRYTLDRKTMEFVTEHDDVRKFEEKLNEQLAKADLPEAESSSQGSTEPWDTPFNRALNILKERPVSKPPTSAGRVCGFEMPTYVVYKGRVPGVYEEWQDCLEQVHKFSGNSYKGYATREEAVAQWRAHVGKKKNRLKFLVPLLLTATAVVLYFTLV